MGLRRVEPASRSQRSDRSERSAGDESVLWPPRDAESPAGLESCARGTRGSRRRVHGAGRSRQLLHRQGAGTSGVVPLRFRRGVRNFRHSRCSLTSAPKFMTFRVDKLTAKNARLGIQFPLKSMTKNHFRGCVEPAQPRLIQSAELGSNMKGCVEPTQPRQDSRHAVRGRVEPTQPRQAPGSLCPAEPPE
jgi:hypothetical protein